MNADELTNEVDQTARLNAFESHDHHRNLSIGGQKKSKTVSSAFAEEKPEQRKCYFPPQLSREEFLELEEKVNSFESSKNQKLPISNSFMLFVLFR